MEFKDWKALCGLTAKGDQAVGGGIQGLVLQLQHSQEAHKLIMEHAGVT